MPKPTHSRIPYMRESKVPSGTPDHTTMLPDYYRQAPVPDPEVRSVTRWLKLKENKEYRQLAKLAGFKYPVRPKDFARAMDYAAVARHTSDAYSWSPAQIAAGRLKHLVNKGYAIQKEAGWSNSFGGYRKYRYYISERGIYKLFEYESGLYGFGDINA